MTRVRVFDRRSEKMIFEFVTEDNHFYHAWFYKAGNELLLCSEVLEGGQTVINLTGNQFYSYCPIDTGFIWADFFLSPTTKRLAVIGCYWACPYEIKVYDFSDPLHLPLTLIESFDLKPKDETQVNWINDVVFEVPASDGSKTTHYLKAE